MNTELKNHHKATIHQAILECCADVLDNEDVIYHQLHLGVSDPVNREESELHIRMADAAYSEYEKTMFTDDTIQSCGLLPSELLKQRDEMRQLLKNCLVKFDETLDCVKHSEFENELTEDVVPLMADIEKLLNSTETEVKP